MQDLARRVECLEKQLRSWRRLAAVQLALVACAALLGAAQAPAKDELKQDLYAGNLAVLGERTIARLRVGGELPPPTDMRGWIINETGLAFRGSKGVLRIAEGPDGVPAITLVDASGQGRLTIGSASIAAAGDRGGSTIRSPSSIVFVDEHGVAFQMLP